MVWAGPSVVCDCDISLSYSLALLIAKKMFLSSQTVRAKENL